MKKLGNKIEKILKINHDKFIIKFKLTSGETVDANLSYIFKQPVGLANEIIKGQLFSKCFIESGCLAWPNGLELCPDSILMKQFESKKNKKTAA